MRGWVRWLPVALAIPFLGLLAFGLTRDARTIVSPLPGHQAPGFVLPTLGGDSVSLEAQRGKIVVLNFWASWCIPCRAEHPVLLRTVSAFPDSEVAVIGVLYQDRPLNARDFLEELGGGWPTGLDPDSRTAIDYGVYGVPETFFIGPDGKVAYKQIGPVTWPLVASVVDSLLGGRP